MDSICCFAHPSVSLSRMSMFSVPSGTKHYVPQAKIFTGVTLRSCRKRMPTRVTGTGTRTRYTRSETIHMKMYGGGGRGPQVSVRDRVYSILPYLVPLLDSLSFGVYVFQRVPAVGSLVFVPLLPLYQIYRGLPFFAFGVFLVLYMFVVQNTNISRFVRFNTYQALILDIILIIPQLLSGPFFSSSIPASVLEILSTTVFYAMAFAIGYAVVKNANGDLPDQIPGISDSVRDQLGPL